MARVKRQNRVLRPVGTHKLLRWETGAGMCRYQRSIFALIAFTLPTRDARLGRDKWIMYHGKNDFTISILHKQPSSVCSRASFCPVLEEEEGKAERVLLRHPYAGHPQSHRVCCATREDRDHCMSTCTGERTSPWTSALSAQEVLPKPSHAMRCKWATRLNSATAVDRAD